MFSFRGFPNFLITTLQEKYGRLRVDVGQTAFFEGREFRTFYEFVVPQGESRFIKVVNPQDVILFETSVFLEIGKLRIAPIVGGSETGTFPTALPIIRKNTMSSAKVVTPTIQIGVGINNFAGNVLTGSVSGGTELDADRFISEAAGNRANPAGGSIGGERGIGASTYYYELKNYGTVDATGVFKAWWEQR